MLPALDELVEGRRSMARGQPQRAVEKARDLVRRAPRDRAALQLLAEGYAVLGRTEDAERVLRQSLKVGPTVGSTVLLAQVVMQQRRFDEAEALLDQAAALEPGHGAVLVARGDLHLLQGHADEALALYRRALESDPYRIAGVARARIARMQALAGE
jgi:tetratricopeptide (TPR) repeat protein